MGGRRRTAKESEQASTYVEREHLSTPDAIPGDQRPGQLVCVEISADRSAELLTQTGGDSVFRSDGAEAGPGEGTDLGGNGVRVEVLTQADQPAARTFGQPDDRMGQGLAM